MDGKIIMDGRTIGMGEELWIGGRLGMVGRLGMGGLSESYLLNQSFPNPAIVRSYPLNSLLHETDGNLGIDLIID
jgi:hypothetical protein